MDLAKFSKQKGSKPKTYFYEKKQQFRESHLEIVSLLVVRPSSVVVFKNFCSFPSSQFPSGKKKIFLREKTQKNFWVFLSEISGGGLGARPGWVRRVSKTKTNCFSMLDMYVLK